MEQYQMKTDTITYVCSTEQSAINKIEDAKAKQFEENYTLTKYNTAYKSKKDRKTGEILYEYWLCTITKEFEVTIE